MMDVKELSITPKALMMNLTMINRNVTMIIVVIIDPTRERFECKKS